jgi:hypothetical protein
MQDHLRGGYRDFCNYFSADLFHNVIQPGPA